MVEPSDFTFGIDKPMCKTSQHPSTSGVLYLEIVVVPMSFCLLSAQSYFGMELMALNIPESLLNLESNCGVFALWMIFQQHGIEKNIEELIQVSNHDRVDGTFTIALAFALKNFGFNVSFYTDPDPNIDPDEIIFYENAQVQGVPIHAALSYQQIQQAVDSGKLVIVYYDTLDGVGNQSLVYSIDEQEICFFDSFEAMPAHVFEQQRNVDGICQQVIVIEANEYIES